MSYAVTGSEIASLIKIKSNLIVSVACIARLHSSDD